MPECFSGDVEKTSSFILNTRFCSKKLLAKASANLLMCPAYTAQRVLRIQKFEVLIKETWYWFTGGSKLLKQYSTEKNAIVLRKKVSVRLAQVVFLTSKPYPVWFINTKNTKSNGFPEALMIDKCAATIQASNNRHVHKSTFNRVLKHV